MLAKLIGEEAVNAWRFLDAKQIKIGGQSVHAVRITYTGELGWELYIPRQSVSAVYEGGGVHYMNAYSHTRSLNFFLKLADREKDKLKV